MSTEDKKTDNADLELIANFMSVPNRKEYGPLSGEEYIQVKLTKNANWQIAHYDTSWDWLMPVVEKIAEMKHPMYIYTSHIQKSVTIFELGATDGGERLVRNSDTRYPLIDQVYKTVVEFIKDHTQPK